MSSQLPDFAARLRDLFRWEPLGIRSRADRDAKFNKLAADLFALQFKHNQLYREFCQARAVLPDAIEEWTDVPAIPASAFKEGDLTCLTAEERTRVFHSSGTTGQRPGRHYHSAASLAIYEASLWPWFRRHVLPGRTAPPDFELAVLTPPPALAPHSSLVHMFEVVRRELRAPGSAFLGRAAKDGSWLLDADGTVAGLRRVASGVRPAVLLGTAFSFVHLLENLAEQKLEFRLPAGSRLMETGGYKGRSRAFPKDELYSLLSAHLGIPASHIVGEYGMSELSSQAYDCGVGDGRPAGTVARALVFPPWVRTRIIAPETGRAARAGEAGLLQVFDLANVFSVMAVQTEDLAVSAGDGFELLGRAEAAEPRGCSLMPA